MSDTSTQISVPQWCGIILLEILDILGEYSLRYSPSTRVANYSDSTALSARPWSFVEKSTPTCSQL